MKGLLIPILVLAGAFWVGLPQPHQDSTPLPTPLTSSPSTSDSTPTPTPQGNLRWLESLLGQLPPASALAVISLPIEGLDLLSDTSPVNLAAMAELRRWQGSGPWAVENIQIQVGLPDKEGAIPLTAKFQGVSGAVVPILEHLLASPFRQGYLMDPSHLRMTHGDGGVLRVNFRVRVLAAEQFLPGGSQ